MATMAKWGSKTWAVSTKKVVALEGLSFSYSQVADNNTSTEEKKTTNERGTDLFPLSFTTVLHSGAGVDVRAEIESWNWNVGFRSALALFVIVCGLRLSRNSKAKGTHFPADKAKDQRSRGLLVKVARGGGQTAEAGRSLASG